MFSSEHVVVALAVGGLACTLQLFTSSNLAAQMHAIAEQNICVEPFATLCLQPSVNDDRVRHRLHYLRVHRADV